MKKILIVSTVSRQFYLFEQGNIEVLKSLGYEVHGAANFEDANERLDALDIVRHPFDIQRSPFSLGNIKAYKQLKMIMKSENFDAVHCHSPMGGVLARLAAKSLGLSPVLYTAHGFHFYKGAPLINWLLYYPVEKWLSKYTDVLITINKEDFETSKKFYAKKIKYIPGVGIDIEKIKNTFVDKIKKRAEFGINEEDIIALSIGELNKNKNHETAIRSIAKIRNPKLHYIICGRGERKQYIESLIRKLDIQEKVHLIGYRHDIPEICKISDLFIFPSKREGLGLAALESMAAGLPIITSNIHGIIDYSIDGVTGYTCSPTNEEELSEAILTLVNSTELRSSMGHNNKSAVNIYDINNVNRIMESIYSEVLKI